MPLLKGFASLYRAWSIRAERYSIIVIAILILIASAICFELRINTYINVIKSGIGEVYPEAKLYELDPFINYWLVNYLEKHGPDAWATLTRSNPDTCIFWYPNCRDFTRTELPGHIYTIYVLHMIAKSLFNIDLLDFMAILPPLFASIACIGIALLIYEITGSSIGAVVGSWLFALTFIDRTIAGFTVKYMFGVTIAPIVLWAFIRALKRRTVLWMIIASLLIAYSSTVWAGFLLTLIPVVVIAYIYPLIKEPDKRVLVLLALSGILLMITIVSMGYYHGRLSIYLASSPLVLAPTFHLFYINIKRKLGVKKAKLVYIAVLTLLAITGLCVMIAVPALRPHGKMGLALGFRPKGLPETVAEYQGLVVGSMEWYVTVTELFITLFLLIPIAIYYLLTKRKDMYRISIAAYAILAIYASFNIAYFYSYTAMVLSIVVGIVVGDLISMAKPRVDILGRIVRIRMSFSQIVSLIVALIVILGVVPYVASESIPRYERMYTTLASSEGALGGPAPAWAQALYFVREHTPRNSLVVSWWDYGYWITVVGNRAALADGATLNGTQIKILAEMLISNETMAMKILRKFNVCKLNDVYFITYAVVHVAVVHQGNKTIRVEFHFPYLPLGGGDLAKFLSAIVYIATGKQASHNARFFNTYSLLGSQASVYVSDWMRMAYYPNGRMAFADFNWESSTAREALLPKMIAYGTYWLLQRLYPNTRVILTEPIIVLSPNGALVYNTFALMNTLSRPFDKTFKYLDLVNVFYSYRYIGKISYGRETIEIYRYVMVYLYKLNEKGWQLVCGHIQT